MNGWILLYKKIWENPRFYKNYKAVVVWIWLLTHCNDKGVVTCGRQQIAEDCGVSESCVYRILKNFSKKYLENEAIINIKPNNRFSTIYILKWSELQKRVNNHRTTSEQPPNTNKQERINNNICSFATFWDVYPLKKGKKKAEESWNKIDPELYEKIIQSVEKQKAGWKDPQFIPYPATWLNQERWEDETPEQNKYA